VFFQKGYPSLVETGELLYIIEWNRSKRKLKPSRT